MSRQELSVFTELDLGQDFSRFSCNSSQISLPSSWYLQHQLLRIGSWARFHSCLTIHWEISTSVIWVSFVLWALQGSQRHPSWSPTRLTTYCIFPWFLQVIWIMFRFLLFLQECQTSSQGSRHWWISHWWLCQEDHRYQLIALESSWGDLFWTFLCIQSVIRQLVDVSWIS